MLAVADPAVVGSMEEDPPAADRSRSLSQPHLPMASEREKRRGGEREERTQRRFKITRRRGGEMMTLKILKC